MAIVKKGDTTKEISENLVDYYEATGWEVIERANQEKIVFLTISYQRIIGYQKIVLNDNNYEQYGYSKDDNGYYIFDYYQGKKVYVDEAEAPIVKNYTYPLPSPSSFNMTYADVDRDGSGRNENDGMMQRERIGHYSSYDTTWDIVPDAIERQQLVKILRRVPPSFTLSFYDSDNIESKKDILVYRGDITENAYMFTSNGKIFKGLKTTFIQFDITPYDDNSEE